MKNAFYALNVVCSDRRIIRSAHLKYIRSDTIQQIIRVIVGSKTCKYPDLRSLEKLSSDLETSDPELNIILTNDSRIWILFFRKILISYHKRSQAYSQSIFEIHCFSIILIPSHKYFIPRRELRSISSRGPI